MKSPLLKYQPGRIKIKLLAVLVLVFLAGYVIRGFKSQKKLTPETNNYRKSVSGEQTQQQWWTCSMHPQIRQPMPGKCPICFMDLILVSTSDVGKRQISFSEEALKLMKVETTPVERKFVETQIRMVGKVDYDESRIKNITAWVNGRFDRLYVDFTGTQVNKGDHMVYLYSPELLSSQAELIQAVKATQNIRADSSEFIKRSTIAILEAVREKLRLLGLTAKQIEEIERAGQPTDHITIYAPIGGIVIEKHATEGTYVETGTKIYTIADLSELWVKLDAYESDIVWIKYGQEVEFTTEAYPGEVFKGRISFIDPILDAKTRTIKLRINAANPEEKLKPNMFVRAVVHSRIAQGGQGNGC